MEAQPENTGRNQDGTFARGFSGNPAGKPKGARHKLSEDFFKAMAKAFEERGELALAEMISEKPADFIKTIAGLQSKELTGEGGGAIGIIRYPGLDD